MTQDPFSSVFSTLAWDGKGNLAFLQDHLDRMNRHAERLDIKLPINLKEEIENSLGDLDKCDETNAMPPGLVTVRVTEEGDVLVSSRTNAKYRSRGSVISVAAPKWSSRVRGTKHGAWQPYLEAKNIARKSGADAAILVDEGAVIDADRATPVILDQDGTIWIANDRQGGVDSVTLKIILPELMNSGMPVNKGRLHEKMIGRCREMILVGTGIGVMKIEEIDGQRIGNDDEGKLFTIAKDSLHRALLESWGEEKS